MGNVNPTCESRPEVGMINPFLGELRVSIWLQPPSSLYRRLRDPLRPG